MLSAIYEQAVAGIPSTCYRGTTPLATDLSASPATLAILSTIQLAPPIYNFSCMVTLGDVKTELPVAHNNLLQSNNNFK